VKIEEFRIRGPKVADENIPQEKESDKKSHLELR